MQSSFFNLRERSLDLSRTHVMGVLNVTPDSFSDGGKFAVLDHALAQAEKMLGQGASIIDIGGESTRPGAAPVSLEEEMARVLPVVEKLKSSFDTIISVDTSTPQLMKEAISLGAHLINDVRAFTRDGAVEAVAATDVAVCVMHMQGTPQTMQDAPEYYSVVDAVEGYLLERAVHLQSQGVASSRIMIDPGFGFGKTLEHNLELLDATERLCSRGYPLLVGMSRKTMIGEILGKAVDERLYGSISAAVYAAIHGASVVRVHDVVETVDAIKVVNAMKELRCAEA